jgi:hypothetical protein
MRCFTAHGWESSDLSEISSKAYPGVPKGAPEWKHCPATLRASLFWICTFERLDRVAHVLLQFVQPGLVAGAHGVGLHEQKRNAQQFGDGLLGWSRYRIMG